MTDNLFRHVLALARRTNFPTEFRIGYTISTSIFGVVLLGYPICWALAEGANVITPTSEMIWYGILDVFTGPIFLLFFLFQLNTVDYAAFGFASGKFTATSAPPARVTKAQEAGEQA